MVRELAAGTFLANQRNAVLVGGTGTGKTHLAVAIARSCIRGGARARFYNVVDLVNRLEGEARASRKGRLAVLVEILAPYKGRVYDPCCGSGGMFISSERFIEAHSGKLGDISIYGQESNYTTWRLAKMNLAIRGIDAQIAHGDAFHNDQHPDLKSDYVLAPALQ
jgi:hypothetical protein